MDVYGKPVGRSRGSTPPRLVSAVLLLAMALALGLGGTSRVLAATSVVVKPSALNGWTLVRESPAPVGPGSGTFVTGPAAAPEGNGSLRFTTNNDLVGEAIVLSSPAVQGTRLDALTQASYSTYRTAGGAAQAPSLQFPIDHDLTDAQTGFQGRLVYEPYHTQSVVTGAWQTWDTLDDGAGTGTGNWWFTPGSGRPGATLCPQINPCRWNEVLGLFPNAAIHPNLAHGSTVLKAGSGWSSFDGNVDAFVIGINGNDTLFDFEPETPCTSICYVNATTGNDAFGGDSPSSAKKTIQAAVNQVSAGGTVYVAPGTYPEAVTIPLAKAGITLDGAGAGADPSVHTIVDGPVGANSGISLPNAGTTGVTIRDLRVQEFTRGGICSTGTNNNNFTVEHVQVVGNTTGGGCQGGVYINGPVSNITIDNVLASGNTSRGIVIWNGFKQNITITNNTVTNNVCCGIELQDGTASGVTISGNTVQGNADSGIAAVGLMAGAGPNVIADNTLINNGRFGIEIKLPNGTGAETGDGSIVVRDNTVERTSGPGSELRDLAGIAVLRISWVAGNNNVDIPTGVVVRNNTVSGYRQPSSSDGFGIVVEGTNMTVSANTVTDNDVGIQVQAGHLPYTPNTNVNGNQNDLADAYFGRGNSPVGSAEVHFNIISGNTIGGRVVGSGATFNGENNWWGCSAGPQPATTGCDSSVNSGGALDTNPWLVDTISVSPSPVSLGSSATVTADLTKNSDGADTSGLGTIPNGTGALLSITGGGSSTLGATTSGVASASLNAGPAAGDYQACATVPNDTGAQECVPLTVFVEATTQAQCKKGGWQTVKRADGSSFKNQGDCIQYVNTGK